MSGHVVGLTLRPEIAALSMSGSSFLVAVNALLLKRLRLPRTVTVPPMDQPTTAEPTTPVGRPSPSLTP